jgi:hypothetical protein
MTLGDGTRRFARYVKGRGALACGARAARAGGLMCGLESSGATLGKEAYL